MTPDVFDRQFFFGFIAVNRLMFGAVVPIRPAHVFHQRRQEEEPDENHHPQHALGQTPQPAEMLRKLHQPGQNRRQQDEKPDRQQHAQHNGDVGEDFLGFLHADLFFDPLVKFGRLRLRHVGFVGGEHELFGAVFDGSTEDKNPAQKRNFCQPPMAFDRRFLHDMAAVALADDGCHPLRPLHHNAFDQSLTADGCPALRLFFVFHRHRPFRAPCVSAYSLPFQQ